jgi:cytochrome c oxidase accessory protein FixG
VYTEIFLWIERKIEGDHLARARLDRSQAGGRKVGLKAAKHGAWIALSLWTGFTFVGYFTPIRELGTSVAAFSLGPWEAFWLFFYGFATYGNAGWMREQVCKYMCPYARFQSAMFDPDTLIITYDAARGEPRGARARRADPKPLGLGACVDCNICVQVCPTGIDIRNCLQYECIGCAACIDGCDQVMEKMGYAKGLIRYSTENALANGWGWREIARRVRRPRVLVYFAILGAITLGAGTTLWMRAPLKMDVIRDRGSLAREVEGGLIENVYRLQIMNTRESPQAVTLSVSGPLALQRLEILSEAPLELAPTATRMIPVRVRADPGDAKGSQKIEFHLQAPGVHLREQSRFLIP